MRDDAQQRWGPSSASSLGRQSSGRHSPGWAESARRWLPRRSPYSWRERDWRGSGWASRLRVVPITAAILIAMLIVVAFAFVIASRAANGATTHLSSATQGQPTPSSANNVIFQQRTGGQPTPAAPQYSIGVWVTTYAPAAGGTVQAFVRVSQSDNPVAGISVWLTISWGGGGKTYGPAKTNAYGIASFTVAVSGPPGQPEFVTANATANNTPITGNTTIVPAG